MTSARLVHKPIAHSVIERLGRVAILVHNAGIYPLAPFKDTDWAMWRRVMEINLDSLFQLTKAFLPGMGFFALAGVMLLGLLRAARRDAAAASKWPVTTGRIVSSTVEHYRTRVGGARSGTLATFYEPVVEYSYRVNGREYHSTQLSFGGRVAGGEELAQAKAAQYPAGTEVGYISGPGGRAVVYADGHVKWITDK